MDDLLSFKDYGAEETATISVNSPSRKSNASYEDSFENDITTRRDDADNQAEKTTNYSFWTIEYYQQFFNVDTPMVVSRILNSMIPKRAGERYLEDEIGSNPDLYGPFWIITTLVFTIAISGNLANYLQHAGKDYQWRYNFSLVSYAATTVACYAVFVPTSLWAAFKWFAKQSALDEAEGATVSTPSLLSLITVYGYSLAIYVPVAALWTIQISALQWLLVMTAAFLSGVVLVTVLRPALKASNHSTIIMMALSGLHFLLAAGFMLVFFHVPTASAPTSSGTVGGVEDLVNHTKNSG